MNVRAFHRVTCVACVLWVTFQVLNSTDSGTNSLRSRGNRSAWTSPRAQGLLGWLKQHNTLVNVDVVHAGPGRGHVVLTQRAMRRGDVLAAIPMDLCWLLEEHGAVNGSLEFAAVSLLAEMSDPKAFWQPFFKSLPTPEEMLCPLVSMPTSYLPLLQSEPLERYVKSYQSRVDGFWREVVRPNEPAIELEQYRYARSTLVTRMFGTSRGNALTPLLDLANHAADCPNFHHEEPCPQDPTKTCMVWVAGTYLAPGAEVCNGYKYMTNDKAMLQYGFLQAGPISHHLHLLDMRDFNGTNFWSLHEDSLHGPQLMQGTRQELRHELARLSTTLASLSRADASAAAVAVDTSDRNGVLLRLICTWRKQRQQVLREEVARLQHLINHQVTLPQSAALNTPGVTPGPVTGSTVAAQVSDHQGNQTLTVQVKATSAVNSGGSSSASTGLVGWVRKHGGLVNKVHIGPGPHSAGLNGTTTGSMASFAGTVHGTDIAPPAAAAAAAVAAAAAAATATAATAAAVAAAAATTTASAPTNTTASVAAAAAGAATTGRRAVFDAAGVKPGLFVSSSVQAGDLLVAVPLNLTVPLRPTQLKEELLQLWQDVTHPRSPRAPYYATLLPDAVDLGGRSNTDGRSNTTSSSSSSSVFNAALQYVQGVQHTQAEKLLLQLQADLSQPSMNSSNAVGVVSRSRTLRVTQQQPPLTQQAWLDILALCAIRLVTLPQGSFLVPIIDAARHRPGCSNKLMVMDCQLSHCRSRRSSSTEGSSGFTCGSSVTSPLNINSSSESVSDHNSSSAGVSGVNTTRWCVVLQAGSTLKEGDEVCIAPDPGGLT